MVFKSAVEAAAGDLSEPLARRCRPDNYSVTDYSEGPCMANGTLLIGRRALDIGDNLGFAIVGADPDIIINRADLLLKVLSAGNNSFFCRKKGLLMVLLQIS